MTTPPSPPKKPATRARTRTKPSLGEEATEALQKAKADKATVRRAKKSTTTQGAMPKNAPEPAAKGRSPVLWLVGVCAVGALVYSCSRDDEQDEPSVNVQRAVYRTQEDCVLDWGEETLCASESDSVASGAATSSTNDTAASNTPSYSGGSHYYGRWFYGPFYTQNGAVYMPNGNVRTDAALGNRQGVARMYTYDAVGAPQSAEFAVNAPKHAWRVEQATVKESALRDGAAQRMRSAPMRSVSQRLAPSAVRSRGGFFSSSRRSGGG